jgi:hypothetical protein
MVCMKLHNLCLDRRVAVPTQRFVEDIMEHDEWAVFDNAREDDALLRGRSSGERRREITAKIQSLGILRPVHASMNSRCNTSNIVV